MIIHLIIHMIIHMIIHDYSWLFNEFASWFVFAQANSRGNRAPVGISLVSSQATPPSLSKRAPSTPGKPTTGRQVYVLRQSKTKTQYIQFQSVHWVHIVSICDHVSYTKCDQFKQCRGQKMPKIYAVSFLLHPFLCVILYKVTPCASELARRQRTSGDRPGFGTQEGWGTASSDRRGRLGQLEIEGRLMHPV